MYFRFLSSAERPYSSLWARHYPRSARWDCSTGCGSDVSKPLVKAAQEEAPIADRDIPYPANPSLTIKKETLKNSIGFFTTKAARKQFGGYVGPRVKGRFSKNKGGYFGAWIEYGDQVESIGRNIS